MLHRYYSPAYIALRVISARRTRRAFSSELRRFKQSGAFEMSALVHHGKSCRALVGFEKGGVLVLETGHRKTRDVSKVKRPIHRVQHPKPKPRPGEAEDDNE